MMTPPKTSKNTFFSKTPDRGIIAKKYDFFVQIRNRSYFVEKDKVVRIRGIPTNHLNIRVCIDKVLGRAAARRTAPKLPRVIWTGPCAGGNKWGSGRAASGGALALQRHPNYDRVHGFSKKK